MQLDQLISADSHVMESPDLWEKWLPSTFREQAPKYGKESETIFQAHPGARDPAARVTEMAEDGVSAEVLYPSLMMDQFGLRDAPLQESCFRVYNDWIIEYCAFDSSRLFGLAAISAYNIENAIVELQRCKNAGLRGIMLWLVPPAELSFATGHYDRLWAAAQEAAMPVSLHIHTGMPYPPDQVRLPRVASVLTKAYVNQKIHYVSDALADLVMFGALERFPRLKIVFVENELSWIPFYLAQYDKYCERPSVEYGLPLLPSEYFRRQVYTTFFNDVPGGWILDHWGEDNCMWSNDFPHPNSTWPNSRTVIARDLGSLSEDKRRKLLSGNVRSLYGIESQVGAIS